MKKLCFASYAKILVACKAVGVTQTTLIAQVITSFCGTLDAWNIENSATISSIIKGNKNLPSYVPVNARNCNPVDVIDFFTNKIIPLLDDSKLDNLVLCLKDIIRNDNNIGSKTIVDSVSKRTKDELLNCEEENLAKFLVGILLYIAKNTNNKDCAETIKSITPDYIDSFNVRYDITVTESKKEEQKTDAFLAPDGFIFDEETSEKARLFCIEYEEDLHLLPLCEIAADVNPEHKHVRQIYTAFIRQNKKTQKLILVRKSIKPYEFKKRNWIDDYVKCFEKEINGKGLSSINFLYDGAKYFHRAFYSYATFSPPKIDPFVFSRKYVSELFPNLLGNLRSVIDDYLFGKENHPNDKNEPPFDRLWGELHLATIEENQLTFWVCRFIIDVCHYLYGFDRDKEYDGNWKYKDCIECEKLETLEDLYYYALFLLYKSYSGEKE